eukprot:TRINITY_DN10817_c0_g1_i1.p3 TRINITY_DN10817_c0_g1~~TRINITY_DN10817_c0_g1_i1.p3  ORF type:complete len:131 (+),score=20.83 TRINITY_DN10817_c0_g1_i1:76-468(+)
MKSSKITRDLDANKEHAHEIGDDDRGDPRGGVGEPDAPRAIAIEGEIHENDADAAENEHETGGETLDDVLAVDAAGEEDDGADSAGGAVLRASDARWLDDDVVNEARDDDEVGEEDEGEDGHGGGKGERW